MSKFAAVSFAVSVVIMVLVLTCETGSASDPSSEGIQEAIDSHGIEAVVNTLIDQTSLPLIVGENLTLVYINYNGKDVFRVIETASSVRPFSQRRREFLTSRHCQDPNMSVILQNGVDLIEVFHNTTENDIVLHRIKWEDC